MVIDVFAVKGAGDAILRHKLQNALVQNYLQCEVKTHYQIDEFLGAGLSSVPAIKTGDKIIEQDHRKTYDEMVQLVIDHIQEIKA